MNLNVSNWLHTTRRRVKEGILQAVGAHRGSENLEFEEKIREFNLHVSEVQRIREAMQIWSDSVDAFCAANVLLAEAFHRHFDSCAESINNNIELPPYRDISTAFKKIEQDINNVIRPSIQSTFYERCIRPTESIVSLIPSINEQIQLRRSIVLDFDSYKSKIQYETEKNREPNSKTKAKLDKATQELATVQRNIEAALSEFDNAKPNQLGNELAAALACISHFTSTTSVNMAKLLPFLPQSSSTLCMLCAQTSKKIEPLADIIGKGTSTKSVSQVLTAQAAVPLDCRISSTAYCVKDVTIPSDIGTVTPIVARTRFMGGSVGGYGYVEDTASIAINDREEIFSSPAANINDIDINMVASTAFTD